MTFRAFRSAPYLFNYPHSFPDGVQATSEQVAFGFIPLASAKS